MNSKVVARQYDCIASDYDSFFRDRKSLKENIEVRDMLGYCDGSILDVGCGTGLLIELVNITPSKYVGVDPSRLMLSKFVLNHPEYIGSLVYGTFEGSGHLVDRCDTVVSMFGSMSYVSSESLKELAHKGKRLFLMFYKPEYTPVTYIKSGVFVEHAQHTQEDLAAIFQGYTVEPFNNYLIVKG